MCGLIHLSSSLPLKAIKQVETDSAEQENNFTELVDITESDEDSVTASPETSGPTHEDSAYDTTSVSYYAKSDSNDMTTISHDTATDSHDTTVSAAHQDVSTRQTSKTSTDAATPSVPQTRQASGRVERSHGVSMPSCDVLQRLKGNTIRVRERTENALEYTVSGALFIDLFLINR